MLTEYFDVIIAAIAILAVVIIYLYLRTDKASLNKEKKNLTTFDELKLNQDNDLTPAIVDDAFDMPDEKPKVEIELLEELLGTEEGDFGEVEITEEHIAKRKSKKVIHKRNVVQHGKITKQNFKEFAGIRILVAEDNLINQKVLTGLLADSGIELVIANDGKEALDILEKDRDFLMILMDAHMPRVDGFAATRQIRTNPDYDNIVIVALSGDTAADDVRKMQEAGMSEHLEKPLRMDALYDIIYAYTGALTPNDNEYVNVIITPELNGDKGLAICGGDEHFYLEILNEFVLTYSHSANQLNDLLQNENFKEADKLLLDILGISANIGAELLHETAYSLKDALNDTQEKSYLTLVEQYQTHLEALLEDIKEYKFL